MRALRGRRSQPAFSRSLGFRSNAAYAWESGRRYPEASLFFKAALRDRDLRPALSRFFELPEDSFVGRRAFATRTITALVAQLVGSTAKVALAPQLGIDRTTLARWCGGKTEPRLPAFLALVQLGTQRLLEFVALFVDVAELSSTREMFTHVERQRQLAYARPLSHAVLRALELDAYRHHSEHEEGVLSRELGLPRELVAGYLSALEEAGQAVRSGAHYSAAEILTIDTREDPERNRKLKAFWAGEALRRFETGAVDAETLFSFNLFAISEPGFQKIRRLHLAYYDQVRAIIEQSESADRVVLMNLQLLPLRHADPDASRSTI